MISNTRFANRLGPASAPLMSRIYINVHPSNVQEDKSGGKTPVAHLRTTFSNFMEGDCVLKDPV